MKYLGDINLNNNEMQNMVLGVATSFPSVPKVGSVVFINKRVYIAVELSGGTPTWVPLTNELSTFIFAQDAGLATWTITHNLDTTIPLVQIYDGDHKIIIPDNIEIISNNVVVITFGAAQSGRAVIFHGSINGAPVAEKSYYHYQTASSDTWVIKHELGRYPGTRVFIGNEEMLPLSIVHDSLFQTTITFSQAYVGYSRSF